MDSGLNSISRDIQESWKKLFDKSNIKLLKRVWVVAKNNRYDERILVLTAWRLSLIGLRPPVKIETTFNFLEIRNVNPINSEQVVIETERSLVSLTFQSVQDLEEIIDHINTALNKIFHSSLATHKQQNNPTIPDIMNRVNSQGLCGGFSETYAALCDYNGVVCREEVQWDVDTIYHSQNTRKFNLLDFSHLDSRDLALIVAALAYNQWFKTLQSKDLKLGSEVIEQILHTLSRSNRLEELELENTGLRGDFVQKLAVALSENPHSSLHSLNLAHNCLEDKGVSSLSLQLVRHRNGLKQLNLSRTSLTLRGLVSLADALTGNEVYYSSLNRLDLSRNSGLLSGEDSWHLCNFLSHPNVLVDLNLSATDCVVDTIFGSLFYGCCSHLNHLNLSRNTFSNKKHKDSFVSLRQFFSASFSLSSVNLSAMKIPADAIRALFQGLASNKNITNLDLNLSSCELRSVGSRILEDFIPGNHNIGSLDLTDNGLDSDLLTLLPAMVRNRSIRHLYLGKNFNVKPKVLDSVLQSVVQLFQDEECSLTSLSVADSKLRARTSVLVNALGSNSCLTHVDISGNAMGDPGARMLSKALQINSSLRSIIWDRNNTSASGFLDVARGLENNYSLQNLPIPLSDVTQGYRANPEKMEEALHRIQTYLLRNNCSHKHSQDQRFRVQQGIVGSAAEQMMSRLCVKLQNDMKLLQNCPIDEIQADMTYARDIINDAENSRGLFPSLYEHGCVLRREGPVRETLDSVVVQLSQAVDTEIQVLMETLIDVASQVCPHTTHRIQREGGLWGSVRDRVDFSRTFVQTSLTHNTGTDITHKISEVTLAVVTFLTNCIVDEILQELYTSHKRLIHHILHVQQTEERERVTLRNLRDTTETHEEISTSIDTLAIKRQSHTRKIRPISNFLSVSEMELDRPAPDTDPPTLSRRRSSSNNETLISRSLEALTDLPSEGHRLCHQTRVRPRPQRHRLPPSRTRKAELTEQITDKNLISHRLDDGLETFYTKRVLTPQNKKTDGSQRRRRARGRGIFEFVKGFSREEGKTETLPPPLEGGTEGGTEGGGRGTRVKGILLPGMGGRLPTFKRRQENGVIDKINKSESTKMYSDQETDIDQRKKQPDPGGWRPPPPAQSMKPVTVTCQQQQHRNTDSGTDPTDWKPVPPPQSTKPGTQQQQQQQSQRERETSPVSPQSPRETETRDADTDADRERGEGERTERGGESPGHQNFTPTRILKPPIRQRTQQTPRESEGERESLSEEERGRTERETERPPPLPSQPKPSLKPSPDPQDNRDTTANSPGTGDEDRLLSKDLRENTDQETEAREQRPRE